MRWPLVVVLVAGGCGAASRPEAREASGHGEVRTREAGDVGGWEGWLARRPTPKVKIVVAASAAGGSPRGGRTTVAAAIVDVATTPAGLDVTVAVGARVLGDGWRHYRIVAPRRVAGRRGPVRLERATLVVQLDDAVQLDAGAAPSSGVELELELEP